MSTNQTGRFTVDEWVARMVAAYGATGFWG